MPGGAQVKNKIKPADRLLDSNTALQKEVPAIFSNIISADQQFIFMRDCGGLERLALRTSIS